MFDVYKSKRVLVTGDSGFKGSWLCLWLLNLGAEVYGYSLEPPTDPSIFEQLSIKDHIRHYTGDIRNYPQFKDFISESKPDIIFHLAAQSLVRESYTDPLGTFMTNVIGTTNLLEAVRELKSPTSVVLITSDKSYENNEWLYGYREIDSLGGYDPYSASKGAAEIAISSWRRSFFQPESIVHHGIKVASARAGNVIGGGDWAKDRIVPDCIRFLQQNKPIQVRNPLATRPWQHVLEPLGGYLLLGSKLLTSDVHEAKSYCEAFNFGPLICSNKSVEELVTEIIKVWGEGTWTYNKDDAFHEAYLLNLTIDKAYHKLRWLPAWEFKTTVTKTVEWYKAMWNKSDLIEITNRQILEYMDAFMCHH